MRFTSKLRAWIVSYVVDHGRKNIFSEVLYFLFVRPVYKHFAEMLNLSIIETYINGKLKKDFPFLKRFQMFMFGYSKNDKWAWKGTLPSCFNLSNKGWQEYRGSAIEAVNRQIAKAAVAMVEGETETKRAEAEEIFYEAASLAKLFGFPLLFKTEKMVEHKYYALHRVVSLLTQNSSEEFAQHMINKLCNPTELAEICERSKNNPYITHCNILIYQVNRLLTEDACKYIEYYDVKGRAEEEVNRLKNLFYGMLAFAKDKGIMTIVEKPRGFLEISMLEKLLGIDLLVSENGKYKLHGFKFVSNSNNLILAIEQKFNRLLKAFVNKCCGESQNKGESLRIAKEAIAGQKNSAKKAADVYHQASETILGLKQIIIVDNLKRRCYWFRSLENALERGFIESGIDSAFASKKGGR
jgi:hypothetical protein